MKNLERLEQEGYILLAHGKRIRPYSIAWYAMQGLTVLALLAIPLVMLGLLWIV